MAHRTDPCGSAPSHRALSDARKSHRPGNRKVKANQRGYCYLTLFETYNRCSDHVFDLERLKAEFGPYPLFRRVAGMLLSHSRFDLLLPGVRLVTAGLYHVSAEYAPVTLGDIVAAALGSDARIGADDIGDVADTRAAGVAVLQSLCNQAGMGLQEFVAEAARKQLHECMKAPDSFLKDALEPLVSKRQHFKIPYRLDTVDTAHLQEEYPELSIVTGVVSHPHAYAAAATIAAEELILRKFNYHDKAQHAHGMDAYMVDIGANYIRHANRGRFNIHCCSPIIDVRDSARETSRAETLRHSVESGKLTTKMCRAYLTKEGSVQRCYNRGENCTYKAKYAMMVHSQYDVDIATLGRMLDAHEPVQLISVMNFMPSILYAQSNTNGRMGLNWRKSGGRIYFDFINDPSMGYSHDERSYIETVTTQIVVTPNGRVYVCERFARGDALFLQYTYCRVQPETQTLRAEFALWDRYAVDKVVISAWDYDHRRFVESKFRTPTEQIVRFKRRFVEVDKRFFDMLYSHCMRSGDKSFNLNEVFSAATTFNTKMCINGNDVRAMNRVPASDVSFAVVTIYCLAYRDRYQAGKTIEAFVSAEKDARSSGTIGLTHLFGAAWRTVVESPGAFTTVLEAWNALVDKVANVYARTDLDVRMLEAVRCVRISEFMTISGEYNEGVDPVMDPSVSAVDVAVDSKGMLMSIVQTMRERLSAAAAESKTPPVQYPVVRPSVPAAPRPISPQPEPAAAAPTYPSPAPSSAGSYQASVVPQSAKSVRALKNAFHMNMSELCASNSAILSSLRKTDHTCYRTLTVREMPADGSCLYWTLGTIVGVDMQRMRRILYDASSPKDEDIMLMDGSRRSWGSTDSVTLFTRLYQCRICVHVEDNGAEFQTELYTDSSVPLSAPLYHIRWRISGDIRREKDYSAHVDLLVDGDAQQPAWETLFAAVRLLPHQQTDEYRGFAHRQELKGLSMLDAAGVELRGNVLELGAAPGAWTRIFAPAVLAQGGSYHAVSHDAGLVYSPDVQALEGVHFHTDDALCFLISSEDTYDLIVSDVADADSWKRQHTQVAIMRAGIERLAKGGAMLVKFSNAFSSAADTQLTNLARVFNAVTVIKPDGCRKRNSECYVLATGYGGRADHDPIVDRRAVAELITQFCVSAAAGNPVEIVPSDALYTSLCEAYLSVKEPEPAPINPDDPFFLSFLNEIQLKTMARSWSELGAWLRADYPTGDMYGNVSDVGVYSDRRHYDYDELVSKFSADGCAFVGEPLPPALAVKTVSVGPRVPVLISDHYDAAHLDLAPGQYIYRVANPSLVPASITGYNYLTVYRCRYTAYDDFSVYVVCSNEPSVKSDWRMQIRVSVEHAVAGKTPVPTEVLKYTLGAMIAGGVLSTLNDLTSCDDHPNVPSDACDVCTVVRNTEQYLPNTPELLQAVWLRLRAAVRTCPQLKGLRDVSRLAATVNASKAVHLQACVTEARAADFGGIVAGQIKSHKESTAVKACRAVGLNPTFVTAADAIQPGRLSITDSKRGERITVQTYGVKSDVRMSYEGTRTETSAVCGSRIIDKSHGTVLRTHEPVIVRSTIVSVRDVQTSTTSAVDVVSYPEYNRVQFASTARCVNTAAQTDDAAFASLTAAVPNFDFARPSGIVEQIPADDVTPSDVPPSTSTSSSSSQSTMSTMDAPTSVTSADTDLLVEAKRIVDSGPSWKRVLATAKERVKATTKALSSSSSTASGPNTVVAKERTKASSKASSSSSSTSSGPTTVVEKPITPAPSSDMATLRAALPTSTANDRLATRSVWIAYPNDCSIHIALCRSNGDTVFPPGLAKRIGHETLSRAKMDGVLAKNSYTKLVPLAAGWAGYWRHKNTYEIIVPCAEVDAEYTLRNVLSWMPADVRRVAIETSTDLGDAALAEIIKTVGRKVCLVDSRTRKWDGTMHLIEPMKNPLPVKSGTVAFPKLSRSEMGLISDPPLIKDNSNVDKYRNSMIEFKHLTANADNFNKAAFRSHNLDPKNGPASGQLGLLAQAGYNVYDQETQQYLATTPRQRYSHAYSVSEDNYVAWNEKRKKFQTTDRYVLVSKFTEIMLNQQIYENIAPVNISTQQLPEIEWINGPPGCGKTHTIVQTTSISPTTKTGRDLVLSMTTEGKLSVQAAVRARNASLEDAAIKTHIRTVASLLVNGTPLTYERVLIDEALMAHAGTVGFVVALTRTQKVLIIGDIHQIPYVDREHMCPVRYYSPACFADITSHKEITYRCPVDVTKALSGFYENFCTKSTVVQSVKRRAYSTESAAIPRDLQDCLYLVHFQSDKDKLIREKYGVGEGSRVLTIHEAQGLTFKHVVCIRTNPKPLELYSRTEYAIVAISRHTRSFVYYTDHDDAITALMKKANAHSTAALLNWNGPRLEAAVAKETGGPKLRAGGVVFEGEMYLHAMEREFDESLTRGLPAVTHQPLVPVAPQRIGLSLRSRVPGYRMNAEEDINYLQTFYDSVMPAVAYIDYRNDQMLIESEDTFLFSTDVQVTTCKGVYRPARFGKLRPRLRTIMQAKKIPSQKESLLGAIKRNLNAPVLTNPALSAEVLGDKLFENFLRSGIDPTKEHLVKLYQEDPVHISSPIVEQWLERQPPSRRAQIVSDLPLHLRPYNRFAYMVKADVKPQLTPSAKYTYPAVQTIVYNDPSVNAIFCPIYNVLFERLISVLHPKVLLFTGMSAVEFETEVNMRLSADVMSKCRAIENDFSKYDKAQQAALRRLERRLWEYVGLDSELSQIWDDSRRESTVTDRKNGVRFTTTYQRKSGEATTFSGNTMVAVCVVLAVMDIDDIALLVAAGDDTLAFLTPGSDFSDASRVIADLFNLECKLLNSYNVPYFCSKFLVSTEHWTYVVHDPLKFVTKLGRLDMSDFQHVEEYRVSCVDTMQSLFNPIVSRGLSVGVCERYGGQFGDLSKLLTVLRTLCHDADKFAQLYVHDRGVILCHDVSARKLK